MNTYTILDNPTIYPSAYMVVSKKGYTKYYYAGTEKECVAQPIQYLPFGENYVSEHTASPYTERFTFTGKERDEETGYGYFGARYMDHELMTMWLSVDPMADKYPSLSPYAYCAWNPVKLVDPDGRDVWKVSENGDVTRVNKDGGKEKQTVTYKSTGKKAEYSGEQFYNIFCDLRKSNWKRTSWDGNMWSSSSSDNHGSDKASVKRALVDVFYDMANNTDIEWALYQYGETMSIGHVQKYDKSDGSPGNHSGENHAPTLADLGCCNARAIGIMLHSHPNTPAQNELNVSIGWKNGRAQSGDSSLREYYPNMQYLVYMRKTGNLISIPNGHAPSVRNKNTTKGNLYKLFNL